ncbi:MAG: hypothetical protein RIQ93_847 [Verrucomicrobiota bacterium]|jgi:gamma-glutamyltranspeptidase/glutathione hydrolase
MDFRSLLVACSLFALAGVRGAETRNTVIRPATATGGMIGSAHPLATDAGLAILRAGGSSFDATVAVAAARKVVEPMMSGILGYGARIICRAETGGTKYLDCSGRIPLGLNRDVFRAPTPDHLENRLEAKVVSTPVNVNAWAGAASRFQS